MARAAKTCTACCTPTLPEISFTTDRQDIGLIPLLQTGAQAIALSIHRIAGDPRARMPASKARRIIFTRQFGFRLVRHVVIDARPLTARDPPTTLPGETRRGRSAPVPNNWHRPENTPT